MSARRIIETFDAWRKTGQRLALATVVETGIVLAVVKNKQTGAK